MWLKFRAGPVKAGAEESYKTDQKAGAAPHL